MNPDTPTPVPQPQDAPAGDTTQPESQQKTADSGLALAIIGLVLAFFFAPLGLFLSFIALKNSSPGTAAKTIAKSGIAIACIILLAAVWIYMAAKDRDAQREDNKAKTDIAYTTMRSAVQTVYAGILTRASLTSKTYYSAYPTSLKGLVIKPGVIFGTLSSAPKDPHTIEYAVCNDATIGRFAYWNYNTSELVYWYSRTEEQANIKPTGCTVVTQ